MTQNKATQNFLNKSEVRTLVETNVREWTEGVWGQLTVIRRMNRKIDLSKEEFSVGREDCDLNLSTFEMSVHHLQFISKVHFKLKGHFSEWSPVYLEDHSRNGTFINGEKVGRGNTRILQNDDEISIGNQLWKVFVFYDRFVKRYINIPACIKDRYYISKELGCGACGIVRLIYDKRTCARYAMKQIAKNKITESNNTCKIMNEANIMQRLCHPFIVNIYDIADTSAAVFLILELMDEGDLFTRVTKSGRLEEQRAKEIFYQLAEAVHYLHSENITHRDLKPENILLSNENGQTIVKLSDFGLSKFVGDGTYLRTQCGTAMYVAPEILKKDVKSYTDKVDVWSLGVILYVCLSGCVPFKGNKRVLMEQICQGKYSFGHPVWKTVSSACKDLICRMLTVDPTKRLSSLEVLEHEWLQDTEMKEQFSDLLKQNRSFNFTLSEVEESLDVNSNNTFSDSNSIEPPPKKHCGVVS